MRIAIASDHAGYHYKTLITNWLREHGHEVVDFGTNSEESVDYPVFIRPAAVAVGTGGCERGVILGGSGNGEAMVANHVRGVRAAVCWSVESARLASEHNNANVISMGERLVDEPTALAIVETWLNTPFEGGRHERRIAMIDGPAE